MQSTSCNPTSKDRFLCSICLDVFTDPVSTPCGHNFCKKCITMHWDIDDRCQCPICKKRFYPKPELQINTLIAESVDEFRQSAADAAPEQQADEQQEVPPDESTGTSRKTWIFWVAGACVFGVFACMVYHLCLKEEQGGQLVKTEAEIQENKQKIAEIKLYVEQSKEDADRQISAIKLSLECSKNDTDRHIAERNQAYTALRESLQRGHAELTKTVKKRQRKIKMKTEGFMEELEQLIAELKRRRTEVELISAARVEQMHSEKTRKQVLQLLARDELERAQWYAVEVTLDPDTAHPRIIVSNDGKQATFGSLWRDLPDNPERFSQCVSILGMQSFSSRRFYFEVQVKGRTEWTLGVAKESINRKGQMALMPQNGYWTIWLRNGKDYKALAGPAVDLYLQSPVETVGVFVDYEDGVVSFYDVDAATQIYSFTGCSFTERLYPYLSSPIQAISDNSAPLIITSVKHSEDQSK